MPKLLYLRCRIPLEHIFYVRFLLEGYEGLVTQTSEPASTVVTWQIPASRLQEALDLAKSLSKEVGLEILDDIPSSKS